MRIEFRDALIARAGRPELVFLTGDLGYTVLEPLQESLGKRFINAGVAEQNMVSVAAGLAHEGHEVWAYSIPPFLYARAFEQIRNDICDHCLPVKLVGSGAGYHYGAYGQSHYSLEDYGVLCTLPHLTAYVPLFEDDIAAVVQKLAASDRPAYLRLGRGELPKGEILPPYTPWRQLVAGGGAVVVVTGNLAGSIWQAVLDLPEGQRPNLWGVAELPVAQNPPPPEFVEQLRSSSRLIVVEEHVKQGGAGAQLCQWAMEQGIAVNRFIQHCAPAPIRSEQGYGSQQHMRRMAGIDPESVRASLLAMG